MPNIEVAISLLKKPLESAYEDAKGAVKEKLHQLRAPSKIKQLHSKLNATQKVKTIWNIDRPLALSTLFHPVSVQLDGIVGSQRINSLEDFPDNHLVIAGTGGQGKSFLMRYLLGKEMRSGTRVPIFVELRHVEIGKLETVLASSVDELLSIESKGALFPYLAEKGKLTILLDGFDELDPSSIAGIAKEIHALSDKFPLSRIVIASRPESGAEFLRNFHVHRIRKLSASDLLPFYKKITRDESFSKRLVAAIAVSPVEIRELINTPLLATLLAMSYKAGQRIPPDFVEFYEQLFHVLFVRHDASKTGFVRPRKCGMSDREIQSAFEAFCFLTKKIGKTPMAWSHAIDLAQQSTNAIGISTNPEHLLDDIKNISCLLLKDGATLDFAHKSVQEFFCARFIKSRPENVAESIYAQMRNGSKWSAWFDELVFLEQIDRYRAAKYFMIPDMQETLARMEDLRIGTGEVDYADAIGKNLNVVKLWDTSASKFRYAVERKVSIKTRQMRYTEQRLFRLLFDRASPNGISWTTAFGAEELNETRTYLEIARAMGIEADLRQTVNALFADITSQIADLGKFVAREADTGNFTSI